MPTSAADSRTSRGEPRCYADLRHRRGQEGLRPRPRLPRQACAGLLRRGSETCTASLPSPKAVRDKFEIRNGLLRPPARRWRGRSNWRTTKKSLTCDVYQIRINKSCTMLAEVPTMTRPIYEELQRDGHSGYLGNGRPESRRSEALGCEPATMRIAGAATRCSSRCIPDRPSHPASANPRLAACERPLGSL